MCEADAQNKLLSDDCFLGFEYVDPAFACTEAQVDRFNEVLSVKLAKERKKRTQREKKEGERVARLLVEEEEKEAITRRNKAEAQEREQRRVNELERIARLDEVLSVAYNAHLLLLEPVQKKVKGLRKKLREIEELECKLCETHFEFLKNPPPIPVPVTQSSSKSKKSSSSNKGSKKSTPTPPPAAPVLKKVVILYTPTTELTTNGNGTGTGTGTGTTLLGENTEEDDTNPAPVSTPVSVEVMCSKEQSEKLLRKGGVMLELSDHLEREIELLDAAPPAPSTVTSTPNTPIYYTALSSPLDLTIAKTPTDTGTGTDAGTDVATTPLEYDPRKISPAARSYTNTNTNANVNTNNNNNRADSESESIPLVSLPVVPTVVPVPTVVVPVSLPSGSTWGKAAIPVVPTVSTKPVSLPTSTTHKAVPIPPIPNPNPKPDSAAAPVVDEWEVVDAKKKKR